MEYLIQKVSYLKGLADGLGIDDSTKEGKLLLNIVDVLEEFADVLVETIDDQIELEEYVTFLDEDLADVEDEIYGDDEFDDFDDCDCDCDCDCDDYDDYDECCDDDCCCHFEEDEE